MTIQAHAGPLIIFGSGANQPAANSNPEAGPSLFTRGVGILDPRGFYTYQPGQDFGAPTCAFGFTTRMITLNAVPVTKSATLIAAAQTATSGTALTLASTTTTGRAVGVTVARADTGANVASLMELDPPVAQVTASIAAGSTTMTVTAVGAGTGFNILTPGMTLSGTSIVTGTTLVSGAWNAAGTGAGGVGTYIISTPPTAAISGGTISGIATGTTLSRVPYGSAGTIQLWQPAALISRTLIFTSNNASGATTTFTINGLDTYGFPMTENVTLTPGSALTSSGIKAFKYISTITPNATEGTFTVSVGTNDVIGFPLRSDAYIVGQEADVSITFNNAAIAASTGYLASVQTTPTATTGDVRGTYALQTSANGTLRLVVSQSPSIMNLGSGQGMFGVTQFTAF